MIYCMKIYYKNINMIACDLPYKKINLIGIATGVQRDKGIALENIEMMSNE